MRHPAIKWVSSLAFVAGLLLGGGADVAVVQRTLAAEQPADTNKERLVLDNMEDVVDWYNGSPDETRISTSSKHVKERRSSLLFANLVDHTKGEKNYPVGWPRTGKDLAKHGLADWSGYDFFECWIYAETDRESLPKVPLGIGFYHSGPKRSTGVRLTEVKKNAWVKIIIPLSELQENIADVRRVQLNISESDYKHGDRVDFYVDDMVLTRFVHPVIAEFHVDRNVRYTSEQQITAFYSLMGRKGIDQVTVHFAIGRAGASEVAAALDKPNALGELSLDVPRPLVPGTYWGRLLLLGDHRQQIDRREVDFRVIAGPFQTE